MTNQEDVQRRLLEETPREFPPYAVCMVATGSLPYGLDTPEIVRLLRTIPELSAEKWCLIDEFASRAFREAWWRSSDGTSTREQYDPTSHSARRLAAAWEGVRLSLPSIEGKGKGLAEASKLAQRDEEVVGAFRRTWKALRQADYQAEFSAAYWDVMRAYRTAVAIHTSRGLETRGTSAKQFNGSQGDRLTDYRDWAVVWTVAALVAMREISESDFRILTEAFSLGSSVRFQFPHALPTR